MSSTDFANSWDSHAPLPCSCPGVVLGSQPCRNAYAWDQRRAATTAAWKIERHDGLARAANRPAGYGFRPWMMPGRSVFATSWRTISTRDQRSNRWLTRHSDAALVGYTHRVRVVRTPECAYRLASHIHRVFSNLKTWLNGTHHGVEPTYLQRNLDEFVFRFNRRNTPMVAFQTLVEISTQKAPLTLLTCSTGVNRRSISTYSYETQATD
jgi:hypothetical protein